MSSYKRETKHPIKGIWEIADWLDDYFGSHRYGVKFGDEVFDADRYKWETRDNTQPPVNASTVEEFVRDFCRDTPRIKPESGVSFYERLLKGVSEFTASYASSLSDSTLREVMGLKKRLETDYHGYSPEADIYNTAIDDAISIIKKQ